MICARCERKRGLCECVTGRLAEVCVEPGREVRRNADGSSTAWDTTVVTMFCGPVDTLLEMFHGKITRTVRRLIPSSVFTDPITASDWARFLQSDRIFECEIPWRYRA